MIFLVFLVYSMQKYLLGRKFDVPPMVAKLYDSKIISTPEQAVDFVGNIPGIGIKPEDLKRLCTEFDQLDARATRRFEGTGLDLALTKKIVEFQKGRIGADSDFGRGSTSTVVMPLQPERGIECLTRKS
jgi:light-regulated signal transduction histidine kinase (bacteriophytochrome)